METKEVAMLRGKQRMRDQRFKRGRRVKARRQFLPQLDDGRSWKRARLQEKHKDTGPMQYAARLPFTSDRLIKTVHADPARLSFSRHMCYGVHDSYCSPARENVWHAAWALAWNEGMFRKQLIVAAEASLGPDAVKDCEPVRVWVSVTVSGMPFRCNVQCGWNLSQGKCSLQEHLVVLQQCHSC